MNLRIAAKSLRLLARTAAPWPVYGVLIRSRLRTPDLRRRFRTRAAAFGSMLREYDVSKDWFTSRLCEWLGVFERHPLPSAPEILEIGSWEGMSALFILTNWPDARLTCVDTWMGGRTTAGTPLAAASEMRFDANMAGHAGRVRKFKGTSLEFFAAEDMRDRFDFVYVDGSHQYEDVLHDAFSGFDALKPGGIMIFDDYLLAPYDGATDCPAAAVNRLLDERRGRYELVDVYWQLVIRKLPAGTPH
ncbi:class I SAM-dependent methyltransferase [Emcibacter sp. SYSU 3D8]|uniref:class I SAM-dependent methyltransferase n=1 Tax=Emcibacter sp. SYSU 3D8 TaxID=3133969 RepID=UPI0031FF0038